MPNTPKPEFSRAVAVESLRDAGGGPFAAEATEAEREALARRYDVPAVRRLGYRLEAAPWGPGGWRVAGAVEAGLTQTCVVTLEPVDTEIAETVERFFAPGGRLAEAEALLDEEARDELDVLGPSIDFGEIAAEAAALAIDPYPRRAGAVFAGRVEAPPGAEPLTDEAARPFAGLSSLKGSGRA